MCRKANIQITATEFQRYFFGVFVEVSDYNYLFLCGVITTITGVFFSFAGL